VFDNVFGLTLTLFSNVKNLLSLTTIAHSSWPATEKQDSALRNETPRKKKDLADLERPFEKKENFAGCVRNFGILFCFFEESFE